MIAGALLSLLVVSQVWAGPQLGDRAYFVGTDEIYNSQKETYFMEWKLTEQYGETFIWESSVYHPKTQKSYYGKTDIHKEALEHEVAKSYLLKNNGESCLQAGGTWGRVHVGVGEFQSCKITTRGEGYTTTLWYADVPFGRVKSVVIHNATNKRQTLELLEFSKDSISKDALSKDSIKELQ